MKATCAIVCPYFDVSVVNAGLRYSLDLSYIWISRPHEVSSIAVARLCR